MTDNTNVGDPSPDGAGGNQPNVSKDTGQPIEGAPQSLQGLLDLQKNYERLERELRGLQSRQDVGQNEVQRFMAEVKQHMAKGKSLEEAEAAVTESRQAQAKDDLLIKMAQKLGVLDNASQPPAAGNGVAATNDVAQVIAKAKLDANDPAVIALIAQHGSDPVEFAVRAGEYRARAAARPQPTPAESPALSGGSASQPDDQATMLTKIQQLQADPVRNRKEIADLKKKLGW